MAHGRRLPRPDHHLRAHARRDRSRGVGRQLLARPAPVHRNPWRAARGRAHPILRSALDPRLSRRHCHRRRARASRSPRPRLRSRPWSPRRAGSIRWRPAASRSSATIARRPSSSIGPALEFLRDARAPRKIAVIGTISDYGGRASAVYAVGRAPGARGGRRGPLRRAAGAALLRRPHPRRGARRSARSPPLRDAHRHLSEILVPGDLVLLKGSQRADHLLRLVLARRGWVALLGGRLRPDEALRRVPRCSGCPSCPGPARTGPSAGEPADA